MSFTREHVEFFLLKGPVINNGPKTRSYYACQKEKSTGQKCVNMKNSFSIYASARYQNLKTHLKDCLPNYVTVFEHSGTLAPKKSDRPLILEV